MVVGKGNHTPVPPTGQSALLGVSGGFPSSGESAKTLFLPFTLSFRPRQSDGQ